jgi:hypothetical protein
MIMITISNFACDRRSVCIEKLAEIQGNKYCLFRGGDGFGRTLHSFLLCKIKKLDQLKLVEIEGRR